MRGPLSEHYHVPGTVLTLQEQTHLYLITTQGDGYYYSQCTKNTAAHSTEQFRSYTYPTAIKHGVRI